MTNGKNPILSTSRIKKTIVKYEVIKATINPKKRRLQSTWLESFIKSKVFNRVASAITGIDKRNAYFIDKALERPINKAAVIVIPERDVPGIKARAWKQPTIRISEPRIYSLLLLKFSMQPV